MPSHRTLGIDPGLRVTGYGLVEIDDPDDAHSAPATATAAVRPPPLLIKPRPLPDPRLLEAGVIRLDGKLSLEARLTQLDRDLGDLLDEACPTAMAVEKLYAHYKHPRTAILMAHARGVILLAAQRRGVEIVHLPATEVKKAVTGNGHAGKPQVQRAVQSQCGLAAPPSPPDVADAIAVALTHARRVGLATL